MQLIDIDWKEADDNPCRLGAKINELRVIDYGSKMLDGVEFPAIVLLEVSGKALFNVLTGRHRGRAAREAGFAKFDAYVVRESDPFRVDNLIRFLNVIEGEAPDRAERLAQLVQAMHSNPKADLGEMAKIAGVPLEAAKTKLKEAAVEERADSLGCDGGLFRNERIFSQRTKFALGKIPLDTAFVGAIKLIAKHEDLRGGDGQALAKVLATCTAERQAAKILTDRDQELTTREETRRTKKLRSPTSRATKVMGKCRAILQLTEDGAQKVYIEGLPADELPRTIRTLDDTIDRLIELREIAKKQKDATELESEWRVGAPVFDRPSPQPSAPPP